MRTSRTAPASALLLSCTPCSAARSLNGTWPWHVAVPLSSVSCSCATSSCGAAAQMCCQMTACYVPTASSQRSDHDLHVNWLIRSSGTTGGGRDAGGNRCRQGRSQGRAESRGEGARTPHQGGGCAAGSGSCNKQATATSKTSCSRCSNDARALQCSKCHSRGSYDCRWASAWAGCCSAAAPPSSPHACNPHSCKACSCQGSSSRPAGWCGGAAGRHTTSGSEAAAARASQAWAYRTSRPC